MTKLEATIMEFTCAVMGWALLFLHAPVPAICFFIPGLLFGLMALRESKNHD